MTECLHCELIDVVEDYMKVNPEVPVEEVLADMVRTLSEFIEAYNMASPAVKFIHPTDLHPGTDVKH